MNSNTATSRYVTSDFRSSPLLALTDLLGLQQYAVDIIKAPEFYGPVLSGITVFRHLSPAEKMSINRRIVEGMPGSHLQTRLYTLISDLSVQRYWYMWSLSDDELTEFFNFNNDVASITDQFNPISSKPATVATLAGGIYAISQQGAKGYASSTVASVLRSPLVTAVGRKFGLNRQGLKTLGGVGAASLIVISGVNIMARKNSDRAKRELAARGLLAYSDL